VAFPVDDALRALADGDPVTAAGVEVLDDGAGLYARTIDGAPIVSHQAFWFAWSQFHPDSEVWTGMILVR